jgi:hypothetical protein
VKAKQENGDFVASLSVYDLVNSQHSETRTRALPLSGILGNSFQMGFLSISLNHVNMP